MNTFLPYPDFAQSAACLDRQRLGKQRVEVLQILNTLHGFSSGWQNHPAVKMWRGNTQALCAYGLQVCAVWVKRGYSDSCADKIAQFVGGELQYPLWLGNDTFHAAHRSNLLRKFPEWYGQFGWTEPLTLPYVWPV